MTKTAAQKAAAKLADNHNKAKAMNEYEKAQHDVTKRTAKLRALRLAKEAADKEAAEAEAAAKPAPKTKPKTAPKKPKRAARTY